MVRRVYLHIGLMKSATSYLQGLCEENAGRLLTAAALLWCPDEVRYHGVRQVLGHPDAAAGEAAGPDSWGDFLRRVRDHPGDALVSNELLAGMGTTKAEQVVRSLPEQAEVHVVITARDLSRVIPSHWQTTIKNGRTWTWVDFAASVCSTDPSNGSSEAHPWFWRRHDLPSVIRRWEKVVPARRMTLVAVPKVFDADEVAQRFGSAIGVDLSGYQQPDERQNASLGAHSVELLRRMNASATPLANDDPGHRYERALGRALASRADREPRYGLTAAQQRSIAARARRMLTEVEAAGVRVVGEIEDLVPDARPGQDLVDPGDATESELLAAASSGLVALAPAFEELRRERNELRLQVRSQAAPRG